MMLMKIKNKNFHAQKKTQSLVPFHSTPVMQAFTSIARASKRSVLRSANWRTVAAYTTHVPPNATTSEYTQSQESAKTHFGFRNVLESEKEQLGKRLKKAYCILGRLLSNI
jgi:vacuolar-type H+-ATPase catalytic subunit A/Vma1